MDYGYTTWPDSYKFHLLKGVHKSNHVNISLNFQFSPDTFYDVGTNSRYAFQLIVSYFIKVCLGFEIVCFIWFFHENKFILLIF